MLTPKKTNPTQTKISELQMAVLVNEKIIRFEIAAKVRKSARAYTQASDHTDE